MTGKQWILGVALAALAVAPVSGQAQQPTRGQLLPPPVPAAWAPKPQGGLFGRTAPGVSTASPLAFSPDWRDVFVGVGYQANTRNDDGDDGSLAVGAGFGNARDAVGLEVVLISVSTYLWGSSPQTTASFKVSHLLPGNSAMAVGVEGIDVGKKSGADPNWYAVASRVLPVRKGGNEAALFSQVTMSIGAGNGRFCRAEGTTVGRTTTFATKDCAANVFASAGIRANQYVGLVVDYTGQDINLGVSLTPFRKYPFVITPAVVDLAGLANDVPRFSLGAGFAMHF